MLLFYSCCWVFTAIDAVDFVFAGGVVVSVAIDAVIDGVVVAADVVGVAGGVVAAVVVGGVVAVDAAVCFVGAFCCLCNC